MRLKTFAIIVSVLALTLGLQLAWGQGRWRAARESASSGDTAPLVQISRASLR